MVRDVYVQAALASVRKLRDKLSELTEDELHACLRLECDTLRRESVFNELVSELLDRHVANLLIQLKEKYTCLAKNPS